MEKINKILKDIKYEILKDVNLKENIFSGIEYDSRKIKEGNIFVALEGANVDGHDYIDKAVENGATCIIVSKKIDLTHNVNYILIENLRKNLSVIASNFFDYPQDKLKIIGITGTNGKTSTTYMLEKLLAKQKICRIGTIDYKIGDEVFEAVNTTPESLDLIKIFDKALKKNIDTVIMEVSSHSLEVGRVETVSFDYAIFTNLTQDHLDYHLSMENYFEAKKKLFYKLRDKNNASINIDDEYGKKLYDELKKDFNPISYSLKENKVENNLFGKFIENNKIEILYKKARQRSLRSLSPISARLGAGTPNPEDKELECQKYTVKFNLFGEFNLYNLLSTIGIALKLGLPMEEILKNIENIKSAPGRFENLDCGQNYKVIVDYAHTPDALKNVILSAQKIPNKNKVITIFGCGGDRDRGKRPIMANISEKYSDITILTSDNPRTENPNQIFEEVKKGFSLDYKYYFEAEREEAIKKAINLAEKNDIILITGKGHETYHIVGTKKMHFDDKEIARREIVRRKIKEENL
ncbi:MAG: UDP-N-acetylmuramoyl-L-alanyl-D-glutamate--2,6-diaminopimelate ligase [Fusobacterium sp.]|nr:UDP-N-acetylmuramoyl-L-alanyl-D-glutamate--2,6-diaminopimelate ligase [Fusobacterium sp.]